MSMSTVYCLLNILYRTSVSLCIHTCKTTPLPLSVYTLYPLPSTLHTLHYSLYTLFNNETGPKWQLMTLF